MFDLIIWYLIVPYLVYTRVIKMYIAHYHYTSQPNFKSVAFPLPFLGHLLSIVKHDDHPLKLPFVKLVDATLKGSTQNTLIFASHEPQLFINDVKVV